MSGPFFFFFFLLKKKKKEQMEMNKMTMKPGMVKEWIKMNAISFIIIYIYPLLLDSLNALGF